MARPEILRAVVLEITPLCRMGPYVRW